MKSNKKKKLKATFLFWKRKENHIEIEQKGMLQDEIWKKKLLKKYISSMNLVKPW